MYMNEIIRKKCPTFEQEVLARHAYTHGNHHGWRDIALIILLCVRIKEAVVNSGLWWALKRIVFLR